jgi:hypothetical protein
VKAGKKLTTKLVLGNAGVNPLMVRRVYCNDTHVATQQPKTAIKSGKKAEIRLDINTAQCAPATYTREVMVITNDPKKSVVRVKVSWTVE